MHTLTIKGGVQLGHKNHVDDFFTCGFACMILQTRGSLVKRIQAPISFEMSQLGVDVKFYCCDRFLHSNAMSTKLDFSFEVNS